jgi:Predicted signal transduction protein with a C-terminal ATPase domain
MNKLVDKIKSLNLIWKLTILYIVLITIPLAIFTYSYYKQSYKQIIENYNLIYREQLYQAETTIRKEMNKSEYLSSAICNDNMLRKYLEFYTSGSEYDLFLLLYVSPYLSNINLLNSDMNSYLIYGTNKNMPRYQNIIFNEDVVKDEGWYGQLRDSHSVSTIWDFPHSINSRDLQGYKTSISNKNVISLHSKIISNYSYKVLGYLELNINTDDFLGYNNKNSKNDQYRLLLLNKSDKTVYEFFKDTYIVNPPNGIYQKDAQSYGIISVDNNKYISLAKDINELNSRLILLYPYKYVQNTSVQKASIIAILSLIVLLSISLLGYLVTNLILKRLKILVDTMKIVQEGNFNVKIEIQASDEIGKLNNAFNMMVSKINNLINTVYIKEITEKKAMLSYLQAQLNPHFLFNILESIRMLSESGRNADASNAIFCLSKLMRSHFSMKNMVSLAEELDIVKAYTDLLNIRFNKRIHLQIVMPEDYKNIMIPPLILEPLIENSIKHGFKGSSKLCMIRIKIQKTNEKMYTITVTDNGKGISREEYRNINEMLVLDRSCSTNETAGCHVGLININTRIKLNYGDNFGLKLFSYQNKGTVAQLTIPCS